jgi:hypothetical protein
MQLVEGRERGPVARPQGLRFGEGGHPAREREIQGTNLARRPRGRAGRFTGCRADPLGHGAPGTFRAAGEAAREGPRERTRQEAAPPSWHQVASHRLESLAAALRAAAGPTVGSRLDRGLHRARRRSTGALPRRAARATAPGRLRRYH